MADTLAEIYRNTLTDSSFDSNGEATIVTTNSSTSHVIKNIQVSDTDTQIPVNGTLKVNDFDIVGLTGNSSGSEIIAPSSTVKVKSSAFPLQYVDEELQAQGGGTNYTKQTLPSVNGIRTSLDIFDGSNTVPSQTANVDSQHRQIGFNLEGNNNHVITAANGNSTTKAEIYNNSGSSLFSENSSYMVKWFDGYRYLWFWRGDGNEGIYKVDTHSASPSAVYTHNTTANNTGSQTSYTRLFGIRDEWLFWWPSYSGQRIWAYNIATDTVTQISNQQPNQVLNETTQWWYAVKRGTDSYRWVVVHSDTGVKYYDWTPTKVFDTPDQSSFSSLTLSGVTQSFNTGTSAQHAVSGSRLYYINNQNYVSFIDFAPDTPTLGEIGSNSMGTTFGADLSVLKRTPSNSDISGRSYGVTPSLKLRMTGVTST